MNSVQRQKYLGKLWFKNCHRLGFLCALLIIALNAYVLTEISYAQLTAPLGLVLMEAFGVCAAPAAIAELILRERAGHKHFFMTFAIVDAGLVAAFAGALYEIRAVGTIQCLSLASPRGSLAQELEGGSADVAVVASRDKYSCSVVQSVFVFGIMACIFYGFACFSAIVLQYRKLPTARRR